jgi:hypothetical protein
MRLSTRTLRVRPATIAGLRPNLAWGGYLVRGTIITQMLRAEATAASTAGPIKIVRKEAVLEL